MRKPVEDLVTVILDEADCLDELVEVVQDQREALKSEEHDELQDLLLELQDLLFEAKAIEVRREKLAADLASLLGCSTKAADFEALLTERERVFFEGAADRLTQAVFALKAEMVIIGGLVEQSERFSAMLLSEWRRIEGGMPSAEGSAGGLDFRG
ncbi:MAG: hypothetical protein GX256_03165 [Fretibacterium sp.]|nr:hypothetical protein [Fretibacterium sp.]